MRIQIQHTDKPAEMREVDDEEEAQQLADTGQTVLVAGRDGGFRLLDRRTPTEQVEAPKADKPVTKVVNAVKKAVQKVVPAKKGKK